jgi:multiple sugar transport system substrate-binding protein
MHPKRLNRRDFLTTTGTMFGMVTGASLLAACQPAMAPQAPEDDSSDSSADTEVVTLEFLYNGSAAMGENFDPIIEHWNEENPLIQVEKTVIGGLTWGEYAQKVAVMIASGQDLDIIRMAIEGLRMFASKKIVHPIDDWIDRDADKLDFGEFLDDVSPFFFEAGSYQGQQYGIPLAFNMMSIWYNTRIFEEAGIDRPSDDWTYDDFLEIATELSKPPDQWGWVPWIGWFVGVIPHAFAYDTSPLTPDWNASNTNDPKFIEMMQFRQDQIHEYGIAPEVAAGENPRQKFFTGKVGMVPDMRNMVLEGTKAGFTDWDTVPWPQKYAKKYEVGTGFYCVPMESKHPEEAWEFMSTVVTGRAIAERKAMIGYANQSRRSVSTDPDLYAIGPKHFAWVYEAVDAGLAEHSPSPPDYPEIEGIVNRYQALIMSNEMTAEEGCLAAHDEINAVIAQREEGVTGM